MHDSSRNRFMGFKVCLHVGLPYQCSDGEVVVTQRLASAENMPCHDLRNGDWFCYQGSISGASSRKRGGAIDLVKGLSEASGNAQSNDDCSWRIRRCLDG